MRIFGLTLTREPRPVRGPRAGGWLSIVREPTTGAWQRNEELTVPSVLRNPVVFRCVTLIASDIGKLALRLVAVDGDGVWRETSSPAFSPVLRAPNRYQTTTQFVESWMISKLLTGNTYVLKERDARGVVTALYVLDPAKVKPLEAPDGAVYYEVQHQGLAGLAEPAGPLVVPAREIIHDRMCCLFHPLVGISPLYACGGAAAQGNAIQSSSTNFFERGGQPAGVMMPAAGVASIDQDALDRLAENWKAVEPGRMAFLRAHMEYESIGSSAVDADLTAQYGMTAKTIAGCFGVPISMVDSSQQPPYANNEASTLQYHSQCLQTHTKAIEDGLDKGLELPAPYGTEFDLDDLIWLDNPTKTKAAHDAIAAGAMAPNEARKKYFGLGPVVGGDSPFLQQQYYSLEALAARDAIAPAPASAPVVPADLAAEG